MTPHPIPQSTALSATYPETWSAHILYLLHAKIEGKWTQRKVAVAVTVVPKAPSQARTPASELAVQSKEFTCSSSRLLAEEAKPKRSISRWLDDKISISAPKAVFSIQAQTAQSLTAGQHISIFLRLDYDTEKSSLPSLPELRLLDLKYEILAKTSIWGDGIMSMALMREVSGRRAWPVPVYRWHLNLDSHFLVNGQSLEIDQYKADDGNTYRVTLNTALISPFKTYNLARSYESEVSLNSSVAEEDGGEISVAAGYRVQ